jgi:hypothetical protein
LYNPGPLDARRCDALKKVARFYYPIKIRSGEEKINPRLLVADIPKNKKKSEYSILLGCDKWKKEN